MINTKSENELFGAFALFGPVGIIFPLLWLFGRKKRATQDEYMLWAILTYVLLAFGAGVVACQNPSALAPLFLIDILVGSFVLAFFGPKLFPEHWEAQIYQG